MWGKCEEQQQCWQRPSAELWAQPWSGAAFQGQQGGGNLDGPCRGSASPWCCWGEGLHCPGFGDGLGARQGMKQIVSSPISCRAAGGSWFDPQGITLMVAPQKGISAEGSPGASQSREPSVVTAEDAQVFQPCRLPCLQVRGSSVGSWQGLG